MMLRDPHRHPNVHQRLCGASLEGSHQQDTRVHPAGSRRAAGAARAPHPGARRVGPGERQDLPGTDRRHLQGEKPHRQEVRGSRMSFAFPALLAFLLVLPGIILRYSYARGPWGWASPTSLRRVSEELAYGVAFALVLHAVWLVLVRALGFRPDVEAMVLLLVGNFGEGERHLDRVVGSVSSHYPWVVGYLVTLYGAAATVGNIGHRAVRRLKLDHQTKTFRFD